MLEKMLHAAKIYCIRAVGSFFELGGWGPEKNEIWSRTEIIQNVRFGLYLLISDFLEESLKANKASKKCHSFYKTVTLKKHHSIYEYQLTKHHKKYTPAKQPKTLLTLKNFQKTCFWLVSKKVSLHHF